MTSYWGFGAGFQWCVHAGPLDLDQFGHWVSDTLSDLDRGGGPVASLVLLHDAAPPQARERGRIAAMLNSEGARRYVARAIVVESTVLRTVLRSIDWIAQPPYPSSYFEHAQAAFGWLETQCPELDLERLRAQMLSALPAELRGLCHVGARPPRRGAPRRSVG